MMYQCDKKLVKYKEYSCFNHSHFLAHSVFIFDVYWSSLCNSIFGNSSSAANNTQSRLPFTLSFQFLWLWNNHYKWPHFFHLLIELHPLVYFIFLHFKTFKIQFCGVPSLHCVLVCKIHIYMKKMTLSSLLT